MKVGIINVKYTNYTLSHNSTSSEYGYSYDQSSKITNGEMGSQIVYNKFLITRK